jgi:NAD+ diphosphatase
MRQANDDTAADPRVAKHGDPARPASVAKTIGSRRFEAGIAASGDDAGPSWWFAFRGNDLLVTKTEERSGIPCAAGPSAWGLKPIRRQYLGRLDGRQCFAAELVESAVAPEGMEFLGLRNLFGRLNDQQFALAGRAIQIVNWDRTHQFCGSCGARTEDKTDERAKICAKCGLVSFPRLSPAIIVAVVHDSKLLLACAHHFREGFYSVLAGFVEPGETLEECVEREVHEEVGLRVKNIRYFGSQPWPFPHSLMIGFTAEYASGEIHVDDTEIAHADWFAAQALPLIPGKISIARRLIDWFVEAHQQGR